MKATTLFKVTLTTKTKNSQLNQLVCDFAWGIAINPYMFIAADNIVDAVKYVTDNISELPKLIPNLVSPDKEIIGIKSVEEWTHDVIVPEEMTINVKIC